MGGLRAAIRAGAALALLLAVSDSFRPARAADAIPNVSGTYWATRYNAKIQLIGGGDLPLTATGKAAYDKNIANLKDGSKSDNARRLCLPDGVPRVLATPYPFEIIQSPPGQTTIVSGIINVQNP